jgi:hypothetical protein
MHTQTQSLLLWKVKTGGRSRQEHTHISYTHIYVCVCFYVYRRMAHVRRHTNSRKRIGGISCNERVWRLCGIRGFRTKDTVGQLAVVRKLRCRDTETKMWCKYNNANTHTNTLAHIMECTKNDEPYSPQMTIFASLAGKLHNNKNVFFSVNMNRTFSGRPT